MKVCEQAQTIIENTNYHYKEVCGKLLMIIFDCISRPKWVIER